jgi:TonB family protein
MDRKPFNPESDSWVDDRMASLDPAPGWNPEAGRALERLTQPVTPPSPWIRLGMTATILATTVFVLVLLPWQKLWTPGPATTLKTTVAAVQEPAPPPAPAPAPQQTETVKPAEKPAPEAKTQDASRAEAELRTYLETLAWSRGAAAQAESAAPTGITQPTVLNKVIPEYTEEARQAKITGVVELIVTVQTDGSVQFESFKKTLGYGLDEKAREAVEKWTFTPGKKNGVPVATTVGLTISFGLK